MANRIKLLIITLTALSLSGYLFYTGLNSDFAKKIQVESLPEIISSPSPTPQVLGEGTPSAVERKIEGFKVTKVVDGDTIEVDLNGQRVKVRYIGIDTPETVDPRRAVGCFGKEASNENKNLVLGKFVTLEKDVSETDRFGRLLRFVYLKLDDDSTLFVNDYLVRMGFAKAYSYPPDVKFSERFKEAESQARDGNRGLWGKCI